jgi:hypothetical protein
MLCTAVLSAEIPTTTVKSGNKFREDGNNSSRKPRAVSKAAQERLKKPQAVTKENLCASSKRKLEAYQARGVVIPSIRHVLQPKACRSPVIVAAFIANGLR